MNTTRDDIDDFLLQKRLAMVGVSRHPDDFSRTLFRELCRRGYDMVAVNPSAKGNEIEGKACHARLQDIQPPVDGVLVLTTPCETVGVVHDCIEARVRRVWMYRSTGQGSVSPEAVDLCKKNGIRVVEGHCPFMFLPGTQFFHRFHGVLLKLVGRYPKSGPAAAA